MRYERVGKPTEVFGIDGVTQEDAHEERNLLESKPRPNHVTRLNYCIDFVLPKLSWPIAILLGCAITAGTTYALVRWVQHLIATAAVSSDPEYWMQQARTQAYDACYHGCNDCNNPSFAYNACAMTAKANVTGVLCDGNAMWNWANRYPDVCLQAVGVIYKAAALKSLKQSFRNRLAIIILTVLAGVVGTIISYFLWKKAIASLQKNSRARREAKARIINDNSHIWSLRESSPSEFDNMKPKRPSQSRKVNRRFAFLGSLAFLVPRTNAYACTGYNPSVNQYFINSNGTVSGVIHGWLSDCYDYPCNCITTCSGGTAPSCSTTCSTCTDTDASPSTYVKKITPKVQACGFNLVDTVAADVDVRVANALIEKNWWVKISVNIYNLTTETDPSISCLHAIGG